MPLRFRPVEGRSTTCSPARPQHLVVGAALLAEMLGEGADLADVAERMRQAEHAADETTHDIVRRVNTTFVTPVRPRGHLHPGLRAGRRDGQMEEAVDLILLYEVKVLPAELSEQVEVLQRCAELTAARCPGCAR